MIVLLPPSETKRVGGDGPPLRLDGLGSPELGPLREWAEVVDLGADWLTYFGNSIGRERMRSPTTLI